MYDVRDDLPLADLDLALEFIEKHHKRIVSYQTKSGSDDEIEVKSTQSVENVPPVTEIVELLSRFGLENRDKLYQTALWIYDAYLVYHNSKIGQKYERNVDLLIDKIEKVENP